MVTALLLPLSLLSLYFDWRFLRRTLAVRFPAPAVLALYLTLGYLYGALNMQFTIAGTPLGNLLYAFVGFMVLHRLFFRGSTMKIAFYTMWLSCGPEMVSCVLLLVLYVVREGELSPQALSGLCVCGVLLKGLLLEYAGRRLQSLRYEQAVGYPYYLLMTAFACISAFAVMDISLYLGGEYALWAAAAGGLFVAAGTLLVLFMAVFIDRQLSLVLAEQQAVLQAAHYKSREEEWRRLARFRHDAKNHLLCLRGLLRGGKTQEALDYLETLAQAAAREEGRVFSGNDFVDAILNEKRAQALSLGIGFKADLCLPAQCRVAPTDLCCIFGNVLDNAIEACQRAQGRRRIAVLAFVRQGQLVLQVKNSWALGEAPRRGRQGHGYGLGNVRRAVEKYGGAVELAPGEHFTFSCILPLQ